MDQRKSNASANGGKKEGNFFTKTAQSIRDKVQGLTNSNGAKKEKKIREKRSKISSKSNAKNKTDSGSDSDGEIATTKSESSPPLSAAANNTAGLEVSKVNRERAKPSTTASANPRNLPDKEPSSDSAIKSSVDHQDTATSPSSSSPTSPSESSTTKPIPAANSNDVTKKINPQTNNKNQIQLSFAGVLTVDDLLDRIDDAIEPGSSEKTPTKLTNVAKKSTSNDEEDDEEPIRIDYNEIHSIDDILSKINQQPGGRRVIIENAPKNSAVIALEEQVTSPSTSNNFHANHVLPSTSSIQSDDPSAPPKSILKTSQNPSALDTSTRTSSFQDEQIHVNIDHPQGLESHEEPNSIEPTKQSQESKLNDETTPTPERNAAAPSKLFSVTKAQVIEKHYDDYPSSLVPQTPKNEIPNASSAISTQKTDENETTDWL